VIGGSINPADAVLMEMGMGGRRGLARQDDVVEDLIDVRTRQDRLARRLDLHPAPNITRLREATDVRGSYAELFRDLQLPQPEARTDGNAVAARIDHLAALQSRFGPPEWRKVNLYRAAQADPKMLELADREIGGAARDRARDKTFGSIHRVGALRPIERIDSLGRKTTQWCGDPYSWMVGFMPATYDLLEAYGTGRGKMRRPGQ
jgi:hypothetical protein